MIMIVTEKMHNHRKTRSGKKKMEGNNPES